MPVKRRIRKRRVVRGEQYSPLACNTVVTSKHKFYSGNSSSFWPKLQKNEIIHLVSEFYFFVSKIVIIEGEKKHQHPRCVQTFDCYCMYTKSPQCRVNNNVSAYDKYYGF